jgi:hypothetical protein
MQNLNRYRGGRDRNGDDDNVCTRSLLRREIACVDRARPALGGRREEDGLVGLSKASRPKRFKRIEREGQTMWDDKER